MKHAIGNYVGVRTITRNEAIILAKELFGNTAINQLWVKSEQLWVKGNQLWVKGGQLRAKGGQLRAKGGQLFAKSDQLRAELAIKQKAYIPDWRAINFIAADRVNDVYCFVFTRKELWIYDGENCPDSETAEKINWEI